MKRANGIDEGGSETSGSKKARSLEEEHGEMNTNNGNVYGHPQHPSVRLNDLNRTNMDVFGGPGEQQNNGVELDLNVPVSESSEDETTSSDVPESSGSVNDDGTSDDDSTDEEVESSGLTENRREIELGLGMNEERAARPTFGLLMRFRRPPPPGLAALSEVAAREIRHAEIMRGQRLHVARVMQMEYARRIRERERERENSYVRYLRQQRMRTARKFARDLDDDTKEEEEEEEFAASNSIDSRLGKLPGPFSEALDKVRTRIPKGGVHQLINWIPSQDKLILPPPVPSLMDLSLKALAENADEIQSLELVPDDLRKRLTNMLCDMRKIDYDILQLLVQGCPTELCIKNCSWISESQFDKIFGNLETKDLRVLQLDLCGQFMLDIALREKKLRSSKSFSSLTDVSLRGACRLTDAGVKDLVVLAPRLRSLNLGQCALLTSDAINYIADSLGPNLRELYIDECLKIDPMLILPAFNKFKCLEVISVARIPTVTDAFVRKMTALCGQHLRELDLAVCRELTDTSLEVIGTHCSGLCCLSISCIQNMTDLGLEHLANGCRLIKILKLCRNGFSDEAMAAFLECCGENLTELSLNHMTQVGYNTAFSIAKCAKKLISLDMSWCRKITGEALGMIVDSCSSLKLLKLFGCRQITDEFFKRHSNPLVRIIGQHNTALLAHLNLLKHEH